MNKTPTIFNHSHDGHKLNLLTVKIRDVPIPKFQPIPIPES